MSFIVCLPTLLRQVRQDYYDNNKTLLILRIVKARSRQSSSANSPYPEGQDNVDILDKPESRDRSFRGMCLQRDSHRSVLTGHMDPKHWKKLGSPEGIYVWPLDAAHIIPFAYASWEKSSVIYP